MKKVELAVPKLILVHDEPASLKTVIEKSLNVVNSFPLPAHHWAVILFCVYSPDFFLSI